MNCGRGPRRPHSKGKSPLGDDRQMDGKKMLYVLVPYSGHLLYRNRTGKTRVTSLCHLDAWFAMPS